MSSWITRFWLSRQEIRSPGAQSGYSQECRGGVQWRNCFGVETVCDPITLGSRKVPVCPLASPIQLIWVQQTSSIDQPCSDLNFKQPSILFSSHHPWKLTTMDFTGLPSAHTLYLHNLCIRKRQSMQTELIVIDHNMLTEMPRSFH